MRLNIVKFTIFAFIFFSAFGMASAKDVKFNRARCKIYKNMSHTEAKNIFNAKVHKANMLTKKYISIQKSHLTDNEADLISKSLFDIVYDMYGMCSCNSKLSESKICMKLVKKVNQTLYPNKNKRCSILDELDAISRLRKQALVLTPRAYSLVNTVCKRRTAPKFNKLLVNKKLKIAKLNIWVLIYTQKDNLKDINQLAARNRKIFIQDMPKKTRQPHPDLTFGFWGMSPRAFLGQITYFCKFKFTVHNYIELRKYPVSGTKQNTDGNNDYLCSGFPEVLAASSVMLVDQNGKTIVYPFNRQLQTMPIK